MSAFIHGWGFTVAALAVESAVFVLAVVLLSQQLGRVRALADYLGYELALGVADDPEKTRPRASVPNEQVRDEVAGVHAASDPAWAHKQVRTWQMAAQRLEPALAFWVDLLRQLGLLFTVVGLGLSLAVQGSAQDLLAPLSLAVWTTVAGLFFSLVLTARFGMRVAVWADTCEKNIEVWDTRRRAAADARAGAPRGT